MQPLRLLVLFVLGAIIQTSVKYGLTNDPLSMTAFLATLLILALLFIIGLLFSILKALEKKKPISAAVVSGQSVTK